MKQILRAIPISFCLAFMASSHALAQKTYAIGLGGGTAIPVGKLNDAQKAGYNGIAMLAMGVADLPFGVRFDAIYNTLQRRADTITQGSSASTSDFRVMGALANLIYAFPGTSAKDVSWTHCLSLRSRPRIRYSTMMFSSGSSPRDQWPGAMFLVAQVPLRSASSFARRVRHFGRSQRLPAGTSWSFARCSHSVKTKKGARRRPFFVHVYREENRIGSSPTQDL